jgi:subtilisin family serine protease
VFPNDEYFPHQWHLHNTGQSGGTPGADVRAPEAWEITTGDANIVIALIDTGVDIGRSRRGCVVLFAAGSDFARVRVYPQKYPEVIVVAATDPDDHHTWYASYGPEVDVAAPSGGGVVVANLSDHFEEYARLRPCSPC